jgi:hypothetical protein
MHTGVWVRGFGMKQHTPREIFKKLVNKNAIKVKIGDPVVNFSGKHRPPKQKSKLPLPLVFQPVSIFDFALEHLKRAHSLPTTCKK